MEKCSNFYAVRAIEIYGAIKPQVRAVNVNVACVKH